VKARFGHSTIVAAKALACDADLEDVAALPRRPFHPGRRALRRLCLSENLF